MIPITVKSEFSVKNCVEQKESDYRLAKQNFLSISYAPNKNPRRHTKKNKNLSKEKASYLKLHRIILGFLSNDHV